MAVLAAVAIRVVVVFFLYHDVWNPDRDFWPFGWEAGRIARSVAQGQGFGNPLYDSTGLSAWMTPVYPYLLAGIFKLFGVYSKGSAFAVLLLNGLFSALTCIPIFYLTRRSFGRTNALWAAWAWALFPYAIYLSGSFVWENCLTALLVAILLLLTLHLKERASRRGLERGWRAQAGWVGYGLLWGFTALVNATTLALLPFLAGWALYGPSLGERDVASRTGDELRPTSGPSPVEGDVASRTGDELRPTSSPSPAEGDVASRAGNELRPTSGPSLGEGDVASRTGNELRPTSSPSPGERDVASRAGNELRPTRGQSRRWQACLGPAGLLVLGLVVMLVPWEVRNYRAFHRLIPLRDDFWLEVWVGNNGNTLHWMDDAAHPSTSEKELAEYDHLGELRYMEVKRQEALNFIRHHPGEFLLTSFRRIVYTWTGYWSFDSRYLAEEPYDPANICFAVPLTLLMLAGLRRAFRRARDVALAYALVLVIYPMVFYVTHPEIRYRHVIDPEIVILAVIGAGWLISLRGHGAQIEVGTRG